MFELDETMTEKLKKISDDLNDQSNALTEGFKVAEKMLAELKLGVTAWATEPIKDRGASYKFGFCKVKGEWRLVCRKEPFSISPKDTKNGSYGLLKTISYMPRHIRIEAAKRLDDLVSQIIINAESFNDDISGALKNIKEATEKATV